MAPKRYLSNVTETTEYRHSRYVCCGTVDIKKSYKN